MSTNQAECNLQWASGLVAELVRRGVNYFALASGSRSSPLALAAARHPGAATSMHTDERAVAFEALGYAKATGIPGAVITTSGTAVANLLPGVVEASQSNTPLLLLTADRPAGLRGTGANQTIDQVEIFGSYCRWFVDVAPPGPSADLRGITSIGEQAVGKAITYPAGPVHLNLMFQEPLVPGPETLEPVPAEKDEGENPGPPGRTGTPPWLAESVQALSEAKRGLMVVGMLPSPGTADAVGRLSDRLGWPMFADITSGLRLGRGGAARITYHDLLLQEGLTRKPPDVVLHLGGPIVSKRLARYLAASRPNRVLQVSRPYGRVDPDGIVTTHVPATAEEFCQAVIRGVTPKTGGNWLADWQAADRAAGNAIRSAFADRADLCEPLLACRLSNMIPEDHALVLGNSMPVRDMNTFASTDGPGVRVAANRGASGIDGNIATAAGYARGARRPVTLLLGDLALLHDMASLQLAARSAYPVVVVVVNNDGGGIFHFLPIARHEELFEPFFGTPHGLHFEAAARQFGLHYVRPDSPAALEAAYGDAVGAGRSAVIEVVTDRHANVDVHERLLRAVREAL